MRKLLPIAIIILIGIIAFSWVQGRPEAGHLDVYQGLVNVAAGNKVTEGRTGTPVHPTEIIKTQTDSRAGVIFRDSSVLRMDGDTQVRIAKMSFGGPNIAQAQAEILSGKAWWNVQPLKDGTMQVETPTVVATVRGTRFSVHYVKGVSEVYVSHGKVGVYLKKDPSKKEILLTDGMMLRVPDSDPQGGYDRGAKVLKQDEKDAWILFNEGKDLLLDPSIARSSSSSPASSSLAKSSLPPAMKSSAKPAATIAPPSPVPVSSVAPLSSRPALSSSLPRSSRAALSSSVAATEPTRIELNATTPEMPVGGKQQLFVTAFFADGSKISPYRDVTWNIDPVGGGTIDSAGTFTKKIPGDVNISASHVATHSNTVTITSPAAASSAAPTVTRMAVSCQKNPPPPNLTYVPLPTAECAATAYYSNGTNAVVTGQVAWAVSGSAKGSITQNGHYTPANAGTDTITATLQNVSGQTSITVP